MKVYAITDVGRVRPINEDSYYLPQGNERFCAVADGMGGHNAGEVASALAIQTFANNMRLAEKVNGTAIDDAVKRANEAVFQAATSDVQKRGMGTTFTALSQEGNNIHIAHVGDSRAYLIRNGAIMRVTMDHTLVEKMVLQGIITTREARVHPKRNYITRALGTEPSVEVDLIQLEVRSSDVFLLCTDGLSSYVEERSILTVTLAPDLDWDEKLQCLRDYAIEAGGPDNITVLYVTFEEGDG